MARGVSIDMLGNKQFLKKMTTAMKQLGDTNASHHSPDLRPSRLR